MTVPTSTERVIELRKRMEALGLKRTEVYIHPDDRERLRAYVAKLNRERERKENAK